MCFCSSKAVWFGKQRINKSEKSRDVQQVTYFYPNSELKIFSELK